MRVRLVNCGPAANESETSAFEHLKSRLLSEAGDEDWILLTNLAFSVTHQLQSDEIDLIAIGQTGVRVVEIKHWSAQWINSHSNTVENEAERLTRKARKVGTTLRKSLPGLHHVEGSFLLTHNSAKAARIAGQQVRGIGFHTLNDWKAAIDFDAPRVLSSEQVIRLASTLQPRSAVTINGSLRRLAGYVNLELQTPKEQYFHRIYKGSHPARRDKVEIHLYDLSADEKNAETKARREFEALHSLQLYPWAPRILDSFQEAPGYEGEMFFFSVVDPAAPSIEERSVDTTWTTEGRLAFVRDVIHALDEFHNSSSTDGPIIHRNLMPSTILVKHDNSPILTGFERTKIPTYVSVASTSLSMGSYPETLAPEVQAQGLSAADLRSDVYSLCASLKHLFKNQGDTLSRNAIETLEGGLITNPNQRATLKGLGTAISELLGEIVRRPEPPPARFWTEDQIIQFRERDYRIISRLGKGGVGIAFKVVEIDRETGDDLGTYVAKVAHDGEIGQRVLRAYRHVRSHLRHTALSAIFEVSSSWHENEFIALMAWVSGTPLAEFVGVFPLLAEELQESSSEALALRWLRLSGAGLDVLHKNGLIHGDISPRNLIVSGSDLVLTDYDFSVKINDPLAAPGTVLYSSPSFQDKLLAAPSDDIYALAATFFHVVFDQEPFGYGGGLDKSQGLNWEGIAREDYPTLAPFLDKATHPNRRFRYSNVTEVLDALTAPDLIPIDTKEIEVIQHEKDAIAGEVGQLVEQQELREQRVVWLRSLLQSYPGSRWGNSETRGLDTGFAAQTYVETELEKTLLHDIREGHVRLVVLCGNAGDGKTALLQHLASHLGLGKHPSSIRILEGRIPEGPLVRMNLDGSASWQGRSADEILDEFLEPFQDGPPDRDIIHLLAINDGRLLEWIERQQEGGSTQLANDLYELLQQEVATQESHIRFISLNQRSLVGGILPDRTDLDTSFLEELIDQLYGGENALDTWSVCQSCSAMDHCKVFQATRVFGPATLPFLVDDPVRLRARHRLIEALQAVHLSGETHITMRELRAALVYILFGIHFCDDYHDGSSFEALPYWDRAFMANSNARQGELLAELARHDPALEVHPQIDRYLASEQDKEDRDAAPGYPNLVEKSGVDSARRRAFFEWTSKNIEQVTDEPNVLDLARGRHLRRFRNLPLASEAELAESCKLLCSGISRLEDLPPQALDRPDVVPLRVTPRTPTETAFWVEKPLSDFRLEADLPPETKGIEALHRQAFLIYRYRQGRGEEKLRIGAELFHLLLELADGYQLGDVSTDDTFTNLSIFVQRLVREDERELLAWNPMQDDKIYRIAAKRYDTEDGTQQRLQIGPMFKEPA